MYIESCILYRDYCNHSNRTSESPEQEFRNFLQKFKQTVWKWKDRTPQSSEHSSIYCKSITFPDTFISLISLSVLKWKLRSEILTLKQIMSLRKTQQTLLALVINRPHRTRSPTFVSNGFVSNKHHLYITFDMLWCLHRFSKLFGLFVKCVRQLCFVCTYEQL